MAKSDKIFKVTFFLIVIITFISFLFTLYYLKDNTKDTLDNFLTAASVAGFFGLIGSFIMTIVQEYYKRKNFKVLFLSKKSSFSTTILYGIQEYFSKVIDVKLDIKQFKDSETIEDDVLYFLYNETSSYDGLIIRPIKITDKFISSLGMLLRSNKHIVLIDTNLNKEEYRSLYSENVPFFVGSDFSYGGQLIADYIEAKILSSKNENIEIINLLGPINQVSAVKRGATLAWNILLKDLHSKTHNIKLNSFNIEDNFSTIKNKLNNIELKLNNKDIIIFAANDNIAKKFMEIILFKDKTNSIYNILSKCKEITIIGYDGIKDADGNYILDSYNMNFATIDVNGFSQGEVAANVLYKKITNTLEKYKVQELVVPKLYNKEKNDN
jgi:hypothetical protein